MVIASFKSRNCVSAQAFSSSSDNLSLTSHVACPLQTEVVEAFLTDMTEEERDLLGHVVTYSYKMTSCHVRDFRLRAPVVATLPLSPVGAPWAITRQYAASDLIQFYSRLPVNSVNYPCSSRWPPPAPTRDH